MLGATQAQKAERRLGKDDTAQAEGGVHDHRGDDIGEDVTHHQGEAGCPQAARRRDIFHLFGGKDLTAHNASGDRPVDEAERQNDIVLAGTEDARQGNGDDQQRERHQNIDHAHDEQIDPTAEIAGDHAHDHTHDHGDGLGGKRDLERDLRAVQHPCEDIAPDGVCPKDVFCGRRFDIIIGEVAQNRVIGGYQRREQGTRQHGDHNPKADDAGRVAQQAAHRQGQRVTGRGDERFDRSTHG